MDEKRAHTVNTLRDFLIENYDPELIILYGSTARGDTDEFSDIDMMVIMDVEDSEKLTTDILTETDHIIRDKHIILKSADEYYTQKDIPGTVVFSALSEGLIQYRSSDFNPGAIPLKSYEERKKDVIKKEYLDQAREFLEEGKIALEKKQLYRCRDFLRFAAVRALKAVMVFNDVHPPRITDLEVLFERSQALIPKIDKLQPFIGDLSDFCPVKSDPEGTFKCRELAEKVKYVIDNISSLIE